MTPIEQAAQALRESRRIVADALEAFGPCDHSVGICNCDMQRSIEQSDAALASLEAAKQEPLTDAQCDAIYDELDAWARDADEYDFYGLPAFSRDKGREAIRKALAAAPSPGSGT